MSDQAELDWWIVKQLRSMVLTDLREFIPDNYFSGAVETFKFHNGIRSAAHWSSEMRWGYLAGELGRKLFFDSAAIMTARQTAAAEVFMNLGMLAGAEAVQGTTQQLATYANAKGGSYGNVGAVAAQLRVGQIPTMTNYVREGLERYLHYLTAIEAKPFLSLLEGATDKAEVQLLPDDALQYFEQVCATRTAKAWIELDSRQHDFSKSEIEKGRTLSGAGFAARISKLYVDDLIERTHFILDDLKQIHQDFGSPLISGIEDQLRKLGTDLLQQQFYGLDGAYQRHFGRRGLPAISPNALATQHALQQAAIANEIRQYIWVLKKVPMKSPVPPAGQASFVINGNVGAIQTASNAVAHVQQFVIVKDFAPLSDALAKLRVAIPDLHELDTFKRERLAADVLAAEAVIKQEVQDETAILKWLAGIGGVVQTIGSGQAAWEAVRSAANYVGLPL